MQPNLSPFPRDQLQLQVTYWPGTSGIGCVFNNKLIQLYAFERNIELFINTV